jgi:hypothetical protein
LLILITDLTFQIIEAKVMIGFLTLDTFWILWIKKWLILRALIDILIIDRDLSYEIVSIFIIIFYFFSNRQAIATFFVELSVLRTFAYFQIIVKLPWIRTLYTFLSIPKQWTITITFDKDAVFCAFIIRKIFFAVCTLKTR